MQNWAPPFFQSNWFSIVLFILVPIVGTAQLSPDLSLAAEHNQNLKPVSQVWHPAKFSFRKKPFLLPGHLAMFLYQKEITYQVHAHCSYYPSCSEFTRLAILKFGGLKGTFLGLDRLSRCNNSDVLKQNKGPLKNGRPIDHPEKY